MTGREIGRGGASLRGWGAQSGGALALVEIA
jgi:hypothetical protein